jgi:hypothetical protein
MAISFSVNTAEVRLAALTNSGVSSLSRNSFTSVWKAISSTREI